MPSTPASARDARGAVTWLAAALLAVALGLALWLNLSRLGARSLQGDEAIYAYPARLAALHGNWYPLMNRDGRLYTSKPPLIAWPVALSFRLNGFSEWADRLPSALAGAAVVGGVYGFAAWLLGPWTGLLAAALLATCRIWLFHHGVRDGVGEALLCLSLLAALLLYLRYRSTGRRGWLGGACAAAVVGGLAKGAIGPLYLGLITLVWELVRTYLQPAARPSPPSPLAALASRLAAPAALAAAGLAPYVLWLLDMRRRGLALAEYLYRDVVQRNTVGLDPRHVHGLAFYPLALGEAFGHWWPALVPAAFFLWRRWRRPAGSAGVGEPAGGLPGGPARPGSPAALAGAPARVDRPAPDGPRSRALLMVAIWPIVVLAILSCSASSLPWYLQPALAPLAILLAAGCREIATWLARWRLAPPAFAFILALLVGFRAAYAWQLAAQPAKLGPMHRFVLAFRRLPGAKLYLESPFPKNLRFREWNYDYLVQLEDMARPLPSSFSAVTGCTFVIAERPEEVAARLHATAWTAAPVETHSGNEAPLYIIDLCGGRVGRSLG